MSHIITRPTRELWIPGRVGIQGLIGWELVHARTGVVLRRSRLQPNLITDACMNQLGVAETTTNYLLGLYTYCGVGADNTEPAVDQTSLISPVGTRVNSDGGFASVSGSGPGNAYYYERFYRVFLEANANGNLTEVGFFNASTSGVMANRQLLKDDLGDPTTIVKTSEHQLRVIMEIRVYQMITEALVEDVTITGSGTHDVTTKQVESITPYTMAMWGLSTSQSYAYESDTMPAWGGNPGGTAAAATTTPAWGTYQEDDFYKEAVIGWEPAVANFATGIGGVVWGIWRAGPASAYQKGMCSIFSPKIPKTSYDRLRLTVRLTWARV